MATVNGITAEKGQEILDQTIESATISGTSLIFTRNDGSTFSAGDFKSYIDSEITPIVDGAIDDATAAIPAQINSSVSTAVANAVPTAVVGGLTAKGNTSGTFSFAGITSAQLVNRLFTATLVGNVTIDSTNFPTSPLAGTQFAIVFKQDATGGRTLTLNNIKKSQGVLDLSTAANAVDIVVFMYDGTSWYAGLMGMGFS